MNSVRNGNNKTKSQVTPFGATQLKKNLNLRAKSTVKPLEPAQPRKEKNKTIMPKSKAIRRNYKNGFQLGLPLDSIYNCFYQSGEEFCEIKFIGKEKTDLVRRAQVINFLIDDILKTREEF